MISRPHPAEAQSADSLYFGTVQRKLEVAAGLFERHADEVRRDPGCASLIRELGARHADLQESMNRAGMSATCCACGVRTGGGCCGTWVADETDAVLLFVNRLMGSAAALQPAGADSCCFLGPSGCVLPAKPFLCVNYDCRELRESIAPDALASVRQARGAMLQCYLQLESRFSSTIGCSPHGE